MFDEASTEYTQMMTNRQFDRLFGQGSSRKTLNERASSKDSTYTSFSFMRDLLITQLKSVKSVWIMHFRKRSAIMDVDKTWMQKGGDSSTPEQFLKSIFVHHPPYLLQP